MELSYRRAQLLELSRILAQCFENVNRYEDFARVDRSEALSAVRRRVQKQIFNFTIAERDGEAVGCYFLHTAGGRAELEENQQALDDSQRVHAERVLELNASHPIFQKLCALQQEGSEQLKTYADILYTQALLIEGLPVDDPVAYANAVCDLIS